MDRRAGSALTWRSSGRVPCVASHRAFRRAGWGGSVRARLVSRGWSVEGVRENGRWGSSRGAGRELTGKWSPRARVRPWSDRWRRGCRPQRRFASSFDSRPFILPVSTSVAMSFSRRRCHSCGKCTGEKQSPCQVHLSSHSRPEPCGPKGRHTCSWTCGRDVPGTPGGAGRVVALGPAASQSHGRLPGTVSRAGPTLSQEAHLPGGVPRGCGGRPSVLALGSCCLSPACL